MTKRDDANQRRTLAASITDLRKYPLRPVRQNHVCVSNFRVGGNPISSVVMAVFELGTDSRIKQWREAYDLKSVTDQIKAAGFNVPT
jgi:hypothetical protein